MKYIKTFLKGIIPMLLITGIVCLTLVEIYVFYSIMILLILSLCYTFGKLIEK